MKWCESCKCEYQDIVEKCSSCDGELSEYCEKHEELEYQDLVHLTDCSNNEEANLLISFLEANDITAQIRYEGSGSYLNIIHGVNFQGAVLFVAKETLTEAKEVLENFDYSYEVDLEEYDDKRTKKYFTKRRIVSSILALFFIGPLVFALVLSFFNKPIDMSISRKGNYTVTTTSYSISTGEVNTSTFTNSTTSDDDSELKEELIKFGIIKDGVEIDLPITGNGGVPFDVGEYLDDEIKVVRQYFYLQALDDESVEFNERLTEIYPNRTDYEIEGIEPTDIYIYESIVDENAAFDGLMDYSLVVDGDKTIVIVKNGKSSFSENYKYLVELYKESNQWHIKSIKKDY